VNKLSFLWPMARTFLPERFDPYRGPEEYPTSRWTIVAVLLLLAVLVFISLHIVTALRRVDSLQDCAMQGRTNCVPSIGTWEQ
jgi:hypothetical protein